MNTNDRNKIYDLLMETIRLFPRADLGVVSMGLGAVSFDDKNGVVVVRFENGSCFTFVKGTSLCKSDNLGDRK
jgi:hypothetical protein